jgi:nitrite reductase/ring-hydroxylating ferredoxin subunit
VTEPDLTRRRALTGVAVGGLSLPLLAACGGGSSSSAGAEQPSGPVTLVPSAQVPVGGGVILREQNVVVTQPAKGTFEGFSSTCTHMGCTLNNVTNGTINCICHGSQFSIKDGTPVSGPNGEPPSVISALPKKPVKDEGGNIVPA